MLAPIDIGRARIALLLLLVVGLVTGLDLECQQGWSFPACTLDGLSIFPPAGAGEFLLSEASSLTVLMIAIFVALLAYTDRSQPYKRAASVFLVLFAVAYLGENNLFRDDVRAPLLALILIWVSIELLCMKRILPIIILFLGTLIAFLGSLGDHTMYIQFEHATGEKISQSPLAGAQTVFAPLEELTELWGWSLYALAALWVFPVRVSVSNRRWFVALAILALLAITVGDTFLSLGQTHKFVAARKAGLFTAFTGVMAATAAFHLCMTAETDKQKMLARSHTALFGAAIWLVTVLAPTIYTHEHNKTVSYATWVLPLLALYGYLLSLRPHRVS